MKSAANILFEELFGDRPLFVNQQDLVYRLLHNPESSYFCSEKDSEEYKRALNRLKAFVSQMLSTNASRNITPIFRRSLSIIIKERLSDTSFDANGIAQRILAALSETNKAERYRYQEHGGIATTAGEDAARKNLYSDISSSEYVLIITARPIDIAERHGILSLQQFFLHDLATFILDPQRPMRHYRFNFPLEQLCVLFWFALKKALDKLLSTYLKTGKSLESLYRKSLVSNQSYQNIIISSEVSNENITTLSNEILTTISANRYLLVFLVRAPIFSVPMIVTDPNDFRKSKHYAIIEEESGVTSVKRLSPEDSLTWKFFVWDQLRTQHLGEAVAYRPILSNS